MNAGQNPKLPRNYLSNPALMRWLGYCWHRIAWRYIYNQAPNLRCSYPIATYKRYRLIDCLILVLGAYKQQPLLPSGLNSADPSSGFLFLSCLLRLIWIWKMNDWFELLTGFFVPCNYHQSGGLAGKVRFSFGMLKWPTALPIIVRIILTSYWTASLFNPRFFSNFIFFFYSKNAACEYVINLYKVYLFSL